MSALPYGRQTVEADDAAAVATAARDPFLTCGPRVEAFEAALSERCGVRHAVVVSSGTTALAAAYFAAGVRPGDEVVTTPLTFSATANTAVERGARVRFADIDPATLNLDPQAVERLMTVRTRAITAVDYAGEPADLIRLRRLASARGAFLIQDAAHALGATLRGEPIARLADLTTLSFHPVKHVTTGEGGAVLTDDPKLAERARLWRSHGIVRRGATRHHPADDGGWFYDLPEIGSNARLSDLQCAMGMTQLAKLDRFLDRRRALARRYLARLAGDPRIILPPAADADQHAWHIFPIRLAGPTETAAARRRCAYDRMQAAGFGVQVHYVPVNNLTAYRQRGHRPEDTPHALQAYCRLLTLPLYPALGDDQQDRALDALDRALA